MIAQLQQITKEQLEDQKAKDFPLIFKEVCRIYRDALELNAKNNFDYISRDTIRDFFKDNYPKAFVKSRKDMSVIPRDILVYFLKQYTTIKDIEMYEFLGVNIERSGCSAVKRRIEKALQNKDDNYLTIIDHFNIDVLSY